MEKNELPADENMGEEESVPAPLEALSETAPDTCAEAVAEKSAWSFTGAAKAYSWDVGPIVHLPKKKARGKEKKKRHRRSKR